jgi:hypothetical protein
LRTHRGLRPRPAARGSLRSRCSPANTRPPGGGALSSARQELQAGFVAPASVGVKWTADAASKLGADALLVTPSAASADARVKPAAPGLPRQARRHPSGASQGKERLSDPISAGSRWPRRKSRPRPPRARRARCRAKTREVRAEGVGFEPTVRLHELRFSRPVHSTTLPPLRRAYCMTDGRDGSRCAASGARPLRLPLGRAARRPARGRGARLVVGRSQVPERGVGVRRSPRR